MVYNSYDVGGLVSHSPMSYGPAHGVLSSYYRWMGPNYIPPSQMGRPYSYLCHLWASPDVVTPCDMGGVTYYPSHII